MLLVVTYTINQYLLLDNSCRLPWGRLISPCRFNNLIQRHVASLFASKDGHQRLTNNFSSHPIKDQFNLSIQPQQYHHCQQSKLEKDVSCHEGEEGVEEEGVLLSCLLDPLTTRPIAGPTYSTYAVLHTHTGPWHPSPWKLACPQVVQPEEPPRSHGKLRNKASRHPTWSAWCHNWIVGTQLGCRNPRRKGEKHHFNPNGPGHIRSTIIRSTLLSKTHIDSNWPVR